MIKIWLSLTLVYLLIFTAAPVLAGPRTGKRDESIEQVRGKIARLGTGERARVTIRLKNGAKLKGYIAEARADGFVLKDKKTGAPSDVLYSDVAAVEVNRGHSKAKAFAIGAAVGAGVLLAIIGISISRLD